MPEPSLAARLADIRSVIAERQQASGWSHPVQIIAVTKGQGADAVHAAHDAGLLAVGENRVQEAIAKQDAAGALPIAWHLIGTLQKNKARHVAGRFALIHSIDRADLATELDRRVGDAGAARQQVLLQVNTSAEPQKGGVAPDAVDALLDQVLMLPNLDVRGLMTMAAWTDDLHIQRRAFAALRECRDRLARAGRVLPELSMGMSDDFPVAVEEGATMIRIGTRLFGARRG